MDSFSRALEELDPVSRALVELSLRRGLNDEDIAAMLGRDTDDVAREREEALRELAQKVAPHAKDSDLPELEDAVSAAVWGPADDDEPDVDAEPELFDEADDTDALAAYLPGPEPDTFEELDSVDEPEPYVDLAAQIDAARAAQETADPDRDATRPRLHTLAEPEHEDDATESPRDRAQRVRRERRQSRLKILLPFLVVVFVVAVIVGFQRSGDDQGPTEIDPPPPAETEAAAEPTAQARADEPKDTKPEPEPEPKPEPKRTPLTTVGAGGARGTASIVDGQLRISVRGLQNGTYSVWLYNSLIDSTELGTDKGRSISVTAKLPKGADDYEYVDVSLESGDANPNHSGRSVLRVPVDEIGK